MLLKYDSEKHVSEAHLVIDAADIAIPRAIEPFEQAVANAMKEIEVLMRRIG